MLANVEGIPNNDNDIYDPLSPWLGNTVLKKSYLLNGSCKDSGLSY